MGTLSRWRRAKLAHRPGPRLRPRARRRRGLALAAALPRDRPACGHEGRPHAGLRCRSRRGGGAAGGNRGAPAGRGLPRRGGGGEDAETRWIVDPIDGTRNFVRGIPIWATLVALEREGRAVAVAAFAA